MLLKAFKMCQDTFALVGVLQMGCCLEHVSTTVLGRNIHSCPGFTWPRYAGDCGWHEGEGEAGPAKNRQLAARHFPTGHGQPVC
jgi:hypothetical protein